MDHPNDTWKQVKAELTLHLSETVNAGHAMSLSAATNEDAVEDLLNYIFKGPVWKFHSLLRALHLNDQGYQVLDSKLAYDNIKVRVTLDSSDSGSMLGYGDSVDEVKDLEVFIDRNVEFARQMKCSTIASTILAMTALTN